MVRVFIGVMIPQNVMPILTDIQKTLKSFHIDAKFVEPENLHLSLTFIGDVSGGELVKIRHNMDIVADLHEKFDISINKIALIPNEKFTRVIALDFTIGGFEALRKDVVKFIGGKSNPGHLTLCRIKSMEDKSILPKIAKIHVGDIKFNVGKISLVESTLQNSGPVYKTIYESFLK